MVAELGSPEVAREEHAYTLGVQAYLWGYPLYAYALTDAAAERAGAGRGGVAQPVPQVHHPQDRPGPLCRHPQ